MARGMSLVCRKRFVATLVVLSVVLAYPISRALWAGDWEFNSCCVPAYADDPLITSEQHDECSCVSSNCTKPEPVQYCTGDKNEDMVVGYCLWTEEVYLMCKENGRMTSVIRHKGKLKCSENTGCTPNPDNCDCLWTCTFRENWPPTSQILGKHEGRFQ